MPKTSLDTKVKKAIINIEKTLFDISIILNDLGMKLCHIIQERHYYENTSNNNFN